MLSKKELDLLYAVTDGMLSFRVPLVPLGAESRTSEKGVS